MKSRSFISRCLAIMGLMLLPLAVMSPALSILGGSPAQAAAPITASRASAPNEALPPGATIETVLPGMSQPIALAFDPAGRLFYTERSSGNVRLFANGVLQTSPVIHFDVLSTVEQGLLGITIDPNFNTNHYIYVYYTCNCTPRENRVARFEENNGVGSNPTTIFTSPNDTQCGNHNGGNIHFGPDGKLFISIGDDGCTPQNSQDVTVKNGKIHRINSDGTIPADNPVFTQTGALPSLYALGLRNPFDFGFDPLTPGRIFGSENGPNCDDEMNRIEAGYNYGWRSGYPCDDGNPSPQYNTIAPLWYLPSGACCVAPTGIEVYSGTSVPQWTNDVFMCSYNDGALRHFRLNTNRTLVTSVDTVSGVTCNMDVQTGPDGALYYLQGGGYASGTLKRIVGQGALTPTPMPTNTAVSSPTSTALPPTATLPVATNTAVPSSTSTTTPTSLPATFTATLPPVATSTATPTSISTATANATAPVNTSTATSTVLLPTNTPGVPTLTATLPASTTSTATAMPTGTATSTPVVCTVRFEDVPPSNTFYPFVQCLACRNIIGGYPCGGAGEPCNANNDPYFRYNNPISRGQIAKIVALSAGINDPAGTRRYEDVPTDSPFYLWIQQLSNRGYMGGYPCGQLAAEPCVLPDNRPYFRPSSNASRGQLSKIVANAAMLEGTFTGQTYADVPENSPFYIFIERLSAVHSIGGYPCGGPGEPCDSQNRPYFRPNNPVTRGQAAKIVSNTFFPNCENPAPSATATTAPPSPTSTSVIVPPSPTTTPGIVDVEIRDFEFNPSVITITMGTSVRWTNYDLDYHTVTSDIGLFDSGNIQQGETYVRQFNEAGSYDYHCTPHPYMVGTVNVTAP